MSENNSETLIGHHFRLEQRRGVSPRDSNSKPHESSRHNPKEDGCTHPNGWPFGRGTATQFPPHVNAGQITRLRKQLTFEWHQYSKGHPSSIVLHQEAGGAHRVVAKLKMYGIKMVGGFIRDNLAVTVFPDEASGGHRIETGDGKKLKKYRR